MILKIIGNENCIYKKKYDEYYECIICFQYINKDEKPIKLNNQETYLKICHCNPYIHNNCLKTWFDSNYDCPICREKIIKNNLKELSYGFYIVHYGVSFYIILKRVTNQIINTIIKSKIFLFFIYSIITILIQIYELLSIKLEL